MPKFVRYRGAGKVPVSRTKVVPGQQGKKDPIMEVWPRSDWINKGEHIPVHRRKSKIYSQSSPIPRRVKKGK